MATRAPRRSPAIEELAELIGNRIEEQMRKSSQSFVNRAGKELGTVMGRTSELELRLLVLQSTLAAVQKQVAAHYTVLKKQKWIE